LEARDEALELGTGEEVGNGWDAELLLLMKEREGKGGGLVLGGVAVFSRGEMWLRDWGIVRTNLDG
jgi:hypothetical protein